MTQSDGTVTLRVPPGSVDFIGQRTVTVTKDDLMNLGAISDFLVNFCLEKHVTKQSLLAKVVKISIKKVWPDLDLQSCLHAGLFEEGASRTSVASK